MKRRQALTMIGAATVTAIAGCSSGEESSEESTEEEMPTQTTDCSEYLEVVNIDAMATADGHRQIEFTLRNTGDVEIDVTATVFFMDTETMNTIVEDSVSGSIEPGGTANPVLVESDERINDFDYEFEVTC